MKPSALRIWPLVLLVLAGLIGVATGARNPSVSDEQRAKASYLFLEANSRIQQEQIGTAYYMMREAQRLDPSDPFIAGAMAEITIFSGQADSATFEKAYSDLRRRFEANPRDYNNGIRFAKIAQQLQRFNDVRDTYKTLFAQYPSRPEFGMEYAWARAIDFARGDSSAVTDALSIYDQLETLMGLDPNIVVNRLGALSFLKDTTAMVAEVERYARSAPNDPEVNLIAGQLFERIPMPDSAIVYYDRACALDSTMGAAYLARADVYLARGDSADYDREVLRALESPNLEFAPKLEILTRYTRSRFEDTESRENITELFSRMMDIHPGEAELHNLYGAYMAAIDSFPVASEQFGYAMDLDPDNEDYPRFRMQTALEAGDSTAAIQAMRLATARFDNLYFPITGSALLALQKRNEEALALLDSARITGDEVPNAVSVYFQQRGDILYNINQVDSALAAYETSLTFNPKNVGSLNNLAYFMSLDNRDLDRAERYVKTALQEEPLNPTYIDTYAWILFKKGNFEDARREIDEALRLYRDDVEFSEAMSDSMAVDSVIATPLDATEADLANAEAREVEVVEEIAADESADALGITADIYDHAGDIYYMCGEPERALEFWRKALELAPENKEIQQKVKDKRLNESQIPITLQEP